MGGSRKFREGRGGVLTTFVAVSVINELYRGPCEPSTKSNLALVSNENAHFSSKRVIHFKVLFCRDEGIDLG